MSAAHIDVTADPRPGSAGYLKWYWTKSPEGLAKWTKSAHPYTALFTALSKYMTIELAKRTAAKWFKDTLGFAPGTPHVGIVPTKKS
jgi:hypothetical protein